MRTRQVGQTNGNGGGGGGGDVSSSHYDIDDNLSVVGEEEDEITVEGGGGGGGGAGNAMGMKEQAAQKERDSLAKVETKAVSFLRYIFRCVLLLTAILVSFSVYVYARNDEKFNFESAFIANSERVLDSFHDSVARQIGAIDALSVSITAYALESNLQFPFVTIPSFEISGSITRVLAGGLFVMWMPYVTEENRDEWEAFTRQHSDYLYASVELEDELRIRQDTKFGLKTVQQHDYPNLTHPVSDYPLDEPFHGHIWNASTGGDRQADNTGPYAPIWQTSPSVRQPGRINNNGLQHPATGPAVKEVVRTSQAVLSVANNFQKDVHIQNVLDRYLTAGQYRHHRETYIGDWVSPLGYPVFNNFKTEEEGRELVGILYSNIYWRLFLDDILPPNVQGVIAVIENSNNQTFSYRLDGPDVTYLGTGDYHETEFDYLGVSAEVISYVKKRAGPETTGYTTVDLNSDFISYQLRVYPSNDMKQMYTSNKPMIYTIVAALIFLITSSMFILYDWLVERRQEIVMDRAVKSSAVVSSLFPEQVRDRLLNEATIVGEDVASNNKKKKTNEKRRSSTRDWLSSSIKLSGGSDDNKQRMNNFLEKQGNETKPSSFGGRDGMLVGRPICDKFENTTVM